MLGWGRLVPMSLVALATPLLGQVQERNSSDPVHGVYPEPVLPFDDEVAEDRFNDNLAAAITEAYAGNPELAARRYDLRAIDDDIGIALSQARPTAQLQVAGGYELTLPGDITDAARPLSDRLNDPNIERNDISSQPVVDQPLWTGGRCSQTRGVSVHALWYGSRQGAFDQPRCRPGQGSGAGLYCDHIAGTKLY